MTIPICPSLLACGLALPEPAFAAVDPRGDGGAPPSSGGPVEGRLIEDLAAASRILAAQGVVDGFGHVSMRHPGNPNRFLMSRAIAPALATPDDIIEYDLESNAVNANGRGSFLERFIHGQIFKARPDVMSVVHSHSPAVIPFGVTGLPMQAMYHNAAFLAAGVPVFDIAETFGNTDMLVGTNERGIALAKSLSDKSVALMRAHGSVAVGPNLQAAVFRAVYTEVSARVQQAALAHGRPLKALNEEEGRLADVTNMTAGMRAWDLWRRSVKF